jgi:deoxyribodipyrimidine photo-lyase
VRSDPLPKPPDLHGMQLPEVGEEAALSQWSAFLSGAVASYAERRDLPGVAGTSGMSAHLKYGEIHPRTMLADLAALPSSLDGHSTRKGVECYRGELCWREFYADVLWHRPETARDYLRPQFAGMRYDDPGRSPAGTSSGGMPSGGTSSGGAKAAKRLQAWQEGRTGYPLVDAGMRQLRGEGWMHNRVRMVVASFLVKDLHLEWQHGARHFMHWLRDGDLASNSHGWQWVAGCGTDAAPYFRVFNPVTQGMKFDPDGAYVRRYVPELQHLAGSAVHEPWEAPDGYANGYPERIVDHATERQEALARLAEVSSSR